MLHRTGNISYETSRDQILWGLFEKINWLLGNRAEVEVALSEELIDGIDGLVNNAALGGLHKFTEATGDEFDRLFNVNVKEWLLLQ